MRFLLGKHRLQNALFLVEPHYGMNPEIPKRMRISNRLNWKQQQQHKKKKKEEEEGRVLTIWSLKSAFPAYSGHFSPRRKSKLLQLLIPYKQIATANRNWWNEGRRAGRVLYSPLGFTPTHILLQKTRPESNQSPKMF